MNDKEKLEAIGRRVDEVSYSITLLVNDIKKILEAEKIKPMNDGEKIEEYLRVIDGLLESPHTRKSVMLSDSISVQDILEKLKEPMKAIIVSWRRIEISLKVIDEVLQSPSLNKSVMASASISVQDILEKLKETLEK